MPKQRKRIPCKKISLSWTIEEESNLISNVKLFPCLYEADCEGSKYKLSRSSAWETIAGTFGKPNATADECQAKWNSIRGSYRRMLHRNTVPSIDAITKNGWPHFRVMEFVRCHIKPGRIQNTLGYHRVYSLNLDLLQKLIILDT